MDTTQTIVAILGALGAGGVLATFARGVVSWLSGAANRERERNTSALAQRIKAIEERDVSNRRRWEAEEHVAILKNQLRELGFEPKERPSKETRDYSG